MNHVYKLCYFWSISFLISYYHYHTNNINVNPLTNWLTTTSKQTNMHIHPYRQPDVKSCYKVTTLIEKVIQ